MPVDPEAEKLGNAAMFLPAVAEHTEEQPVRDSEQLPSATLRAGMESGELPGNAEPQTELALKAKTRNPDSLPTVGGTFSAGGALPAGKLSQNVGHSEPKSPQNSVFEGGVGKYMAQTKTLKTRRFRVSVRPKQNWPYRQKKNPELALASGETVFAASLNRGGKPPFRGSECLLAFDFGQGLENLGCYRKGRIGAQKRSIMVMRLGESDGGSLAVLICCSK